MNVYSPPGVNYPRSIVEEGSAVFCAESIVNKHVTRFGLVQDIAETVNTRLLAHFPEAFSIRTQYDLDIKNKFRLRNLYNADCHVVTDAYTNQPSILKLQSRWEFQNPKSLTNRSTELFLKTRERNTSGPRVSETDWSIDQRAPSLVQVHPTFSVHLKAAELVSQLLSGFGDVDGLHVAKFVFQSADEQFPHERLQNVFVGIRNVPEKRNSFLRNGPVIQSHLTINRSQYDRAKVSMSDRRLPNGKLRAYVALGSNIGNCIGTIELACTHMNNRGLKVARTSGLYETKAMYVEDQQNFINGACEVIKLCLRLCFVRANKNRLRLL